MSEDYFWWKKETEEEKSMKLLIAKAQALGRLPTLTEISEDPKLPGLYVFARFYGSADAALEKLAGLLYGNARRTYPTELLPRELKTLTVAQQEELKAKLQSDYLCRLQELQEPKALREALRGYQKVVDLAETTEKVVVIPTKRHLRLSEYTRQGASQFSPAIDDEEKRIERKIAREEKQAEQRAARKEKWGFTARKASKVEPSARSKVEPCVGLKVKPDVEPKVELEMEPDAELVPPAIPGVELTQQVVAAVAAEAVQTVMTVLEEEQEMPKKPYTYEEALRGLKQAYEFYGDVPTVRQVAEFARDRPGCPGAAPTQKLLGPSSGWAKLLGVEKAPRGGKEPPVPKPVPDGGGEPLVPDSVPGSIEESPMPEVASSESLAEVGQVPASTDEPKLVTMRLSGDLNVDVCLHGQRYCVQIKLGGPEQKAVELADAGQETLLQESS